MIKKIISKWYTLFIVLVAIFIITSGILAIVIPNNMIRIFSNVNSGTLNTYIDIVTNIVTTLILVIAYKLLTKRNLRSIGYTSLSKPNSWINLAKGTAIGTLSIVSVYGFLYAIGYIKTAPSLSYSAIGLYFIMFVTVSILEETLSRGVLQSVLEYSKNSYVAILLPSIFFGLIHLGNQNISMLPILNTILAGIIFAVFTYITKSIYLAIGFHTAWNFVQSSVLGLPISGSSMVGHQILESKITGGQLISGGAYGVEGGLVCTACFSIILLIQVTYLLRKSKKIKINS